jgi:PilZ domain
VRTPGHISRGPRSPTHHPAALVREDGRESPVIITEVSEGGFRLFVFETPRIGEHVFLRADGYGDFPAQIRWALGSDAGGAFIQSTEVE